MVSSCRALIGARIDPQLAGVSVEAHPIEISAEEQERANDIAGLIARKIARGTETLKRDASRLPSEILRTGVLAPRPILSAAGAEGEFLVGEFDREAQAKAESRSQRNG